MKVRIYECLLDARNDFVVDDTTVGAMIAALDRPYLWGTRERKRIDTVVIHHISAVNVDPMRSCNLGLILEIFCKYSVSCHYLITRSGGTYLLVPEEMKAWHCGPSIMPEPDNRIDVNQFSIGIELVGTKDTEFTPVQYKSLKLLCRDIEKRYGRKMRYVGHEHIAGERAVSMGLRAEPKTDPGPMFDWDKFRKSIE